MIRLNRLTDYAVVMLAHMGREIGSVHTAAQMAQESGVPAPTVAKLMKQLAAAGVLVSHRGAAGGYSLERSPAHVSVAEIVEALEGPISLTACVDGAHGACEVESLCLMRGNWDRVNTAIRAALEAVSLADMAPLPPAFAGAPPKRRELHVGG